MLDKTYRPGSVETRQYEAWERAGCFAADPSSKKRPYTIMMPPPNVTGSLHMGHALTFTLQDILIRFERMRGRDALWQPGTDHAGIATEIVVTDQLAERQINKHDLGREKFIERVWEWKAESGGTITRQLRRLGASADWRRERFTMDSGLSAAVRRVFVALYREGLIYRDKRLVNWDPVMHTVISDLEVESRETKGKLWHIRYPVEGEGGRFIIVATTRPETMLGDTGVAVHPEDQRYADLVGKSVRSAARRPADPGRCRRIRRSGHGQRRGQDHPGARFQRLRGGAPAWSRDDQYLRPRRASERRGARTLPRARTFRGAPPGARGSRSRRSDREGRGPSPDGAAPRPLGRGDRAVADRPVVLQRRRTGQAGDRSGRKRANPLRAAAMGKHVFRMDAQHPALVHLAAIVVGASDPGLVRPGRHGVRRRKRGRGGQRGGGALRQRGRALARGGRARHLVFLGAVAVLDAWAGRNRRPSWRAITPAMCWSPASTSSSSGSPA